MPRSRATASETGGNSRENQQSMYDAKSAQVKKLLKEKKKQFVKLRKSWSVPKKIVPECIMTPEEFSSHWNEQARLYLINSIARLELNLTGAGFQPPYNSSLTLGVFFFDKVFVQILSWTNGYIRVEKLDESELQLYEVYQWWSIFSYSQLTNLNMETVLRNFQMMFPNYRLPNKERLSFITRNFKIFSAVNRGNAAGLISWNAQRDQTAQLSEFESLIFREVQSSFIDSDYQLGTIDDEVFGCRAQDLQVKKLNERKADGEGWGADVVADPLTRLPLAARLSRLDVSQSTNVRIMLDSMMDKHSGITKGLSLFGADRGYASHQLIQECAKRGMGIVSVFPNHILNAHPFCPESKYVESFKGVGPKAVLFPLQENKKMNKAEAKVEKFIINDGPFLGPVCLKSTTIIPGVPNARETAFVIRESGDKNQSKILRFALHANDTVLNRLNCAVGIPKPTTVRFRKAHLFGETDEDYNSSDQDNDAGGSDDDNLNSDEGSGYAPHTPIPVRKRAILPLEHLEDSDDDMEHGARATQRSRLHSPQYLSFTSPVFTPGYFKSPASHPNHTKRGQSSDDDLPQTEGSPQQATRLEESGEESSISSILSSSDEDTTGIGNIFTMDHEQPSDDDDVSEANDDDWSLCEKDEEGNKSYSDFVNIAGSFIEKKHLPKDVVADLKAFAENRLEEVVEILSVGQRDLIWHWMRRHRITGTITKKIFSHHSRTRQYVTQQTEESEVSPPGELLRELIVSSWYSKTRSTDAMKRGQMNEEAVANQLQSLPSVVGFWEAGLYARKEKPYFACSPDGIVVLLQRDEQNEDVTDSAGKLELAVVEIKTAICPSSVAYAIDNAGHHVCTFGDRRFFRLVNRDHRCQLLMEAYVTNVKVVIYIYATETSAPCTVFVHFTQEMLNAAEEALLSVENAVKWLHVPSFSELKLPNNLKQHIPPSVEEVIFSNWEWWNVIRSYVQKREGRARPIKTLKWGIQVVYNMLKPGVDGVTQYRSQMRSATTKLKWEQNVGTKMLKTLNITVFIISRILQCKDRLNKESFPGLLKYRKELNRTNTFASFIQDNAEAMLKHAHEISPIIPNSDFQTPCAKLPLHYGEGESKMAVDEMLESVRSTKRKDKLFNTLGYKDMRLDLMAGHFLEETEKQMYCSFPGCKSRPKTKCCVCNVGLCAVPCLKKWHTMDTLDEQSPSDD